MYFVYLPKTKFNIYEKNVENELLEYWDNIDLNNLRNKKRENCKTFILHDGPPYANGPIHMGHAENKIWKDCLNKIYWQSGYNVDFVLGWDAHGLPIENAVEKKLQKEEIDKKSLTRQEFWDHCYNFATYWVSEQKKAFKKLGVFADYDNPYITFKEEESIGIIECIHNFVQYLELRYRPVLWSSVEKTALAYAEVEYKDKVSQSIYIAFKIIESEHAILQNLNLLVWTTTPWTLPANQALAYNKDFEYVIFTLNGEKYCAEKLLFKTLDFAQEAVIEETVKGNIFENSYAQHCLHNEFPEKRILIHSKHVDSTKGTGFVHIAPAHGEEDFELTKTYNLKLEDLFNDSMVFNSNIELVGGLSIKQGEEKIIETLKNRNLIFKLEEITHSCPHSWRSKAPLNYRLTKQWFLDMKPLKENAMRIVDNESFKWIPNESKNRFTSMLEKREDWCVSRQRIWGVPFGIFYNKNTQKILDNPVFLEKTREHLGKIGVKNWWNVKIEDIDTQYSSNDYTRVDDIVDIWFESGSTQSFVLKKRGCFPADVYLEGSDQHRGWFQSTLLISATQSGASAWKNLITHGFCLDGQKQKMSKSIGNVIDPLTWDIDTLRIFFSSLYLCTDIALSEASVKHAHEIVFRFKNTIKFLLGNLAISKSVENVEYNKLPDLEKWILHKIFELDVLYNEILTNFCLNNYVNKLYEFCAQDLSSFYFDIRKDTLYCEKEDDFARCCVITVFRILTPILIKSLSIFMPYSMEKAWLCYLEENCKEKESVHLQEKEEIFPFYQNEEVNNKIVKLAEIKKLVNEKIELLRAAKEITTSYEVEVFVDYDGDLEELRKILIVSKVTQSKEFDVKILRSQKCPRCKFYHEQLINDVCARCFDVLESIK